MPKLIPSHTHSMCVCGGACLCVYAWCTLDLYRAIYTHASKDQGMLEASTFTLTLFFETGTLPKPEACHYGELIQLTTELPASIYPCLQCSGVKVCMVTCSSFNTGAVDLNSGSYCFHREHSYPLSLSPVSRFFLWIVLVCFDTV